MSVFGLTPRLRDCQLAIQRLSENGVSPCFEAIASELGLKSKGGISKYLNSLAERGYIEWRPRRARSIVVIHELTDDEPQFEITAAGAAEMLVYRETP